VSVEFFVPGIPQPQGSKRGFVTATGKVNMVESAAGVKPWRSDVKVFAAEAMTGPLLTGPVFLHCHFVMKRPMSTPKTKPTPPATKKPDLDKLLRAIGDALKGTVYAEDSLIVDMVGTKRIAEDGEQPGVHINVGHRDDR
jgi:Holliday junction resolvase RusA-like endonuclease